MLRNMVPADPVAQTRKVAERLASEWQLKLGEALLDATCSLVLDAGNDTILKVPYPDAEEAGSWRTVQAFSRHGGVTLLKQDNMSGAILMPWLHPGTPLRDPGINDLEAVTICSNVILKLRSAPREEGIPFARWFRPLLNAPELPIVRDAKHILLDLMADCPEPTLLHGDLHHANILRHGSEWVVIDPKGLIGDPSFEVVGFMRNPGNYLPDAAGMRDRLERFAECLGDPIERLWGWSFVETVNCSVPPFGFDWSEAAHAIWEARP